MSRFAYPFICCWTLGFFHVLVTGDSAALKMQVHVLISIPVFSSLGTYLGVKLLGHMVILCLTF